MSSGKALTAVAMVALVVILFAASGRAFAGGWTSGGGELLESSPNPWFIHAGGTTSTASHRVLRYCILVDEENFGVTRRDLENQVQSALHGWRDEFAAAYVPDNGVGNRVHVATELFVESDTGCDDVAIRFQFGVLSDDQLREFDAHGQDPHKLVAVAVRTAYDDKTLDGKGFIYVAPPKGPLAMAGRDISNAPWQDQSQILLSAILRHELGHVFGLSHNGTFKELMGAGFPEYLVSKRTNLFFFGPGTFKIPVGVDLNTSCIYPSPDHPQQFPEGLVKFFGIPPAFNCFAARYFPDKLQIVARPDANSGRVTVIGEAMLDPDVQTTRVPLVRLWLPDAQTVFTKIPDYLGKILTGPMVVKTEHTGTYTVLATRETRLIKVLLAPEKVQVDGVFEGRIHLDLTAYPWFKP